VQKASRRRVNHDLIQSSVFQPCDVTPVKVR
jgi:hypothetical protein